METKVITGKVRFSYANVWEPRSIEGSNPKYSVSLIIPKEDKETVARIKKAIEAAKEEGKHSKFSGKIPPNLKTPLRDGDTDKPDDEAYQNAYFLNANSVQAPGIVDRKAHAILQQSDFYSGCYGRASINFFPYNTNGNRGIGAGLNNLQKFEDGEPLGGRSRAEDEFDAVDDDDDMSILG